MQIPQERLGKILELYKPECRYLVESSVNFPKAAGIFKIEDTYYTSQKLEHMTSIEAQFCLNQLSYAAFSEWTQKNRFENLDLPFEDYLWLMKENMFIVDSKIRFQKPISKDKEIPAIIELVNSRRIENLYLAFLDYNIEDKSKGRLELALKL
ncbi:hypothetical protein KY345_01290 [Candidatus Woesearchaeota archaeon]|nr:hypothetical protein [Candidatus Woesearchaeota archaeon]